MVDKIAEAVDLAVQSHDATALAALLDGESDWIGSQDELPCFSDLHEAYAGTVASGLLVGYVLATSDNAKLTEMADLASTSVAKFKGRVAGATTACSTAAAAASTPIPDKPSPTPETDWYPAGFKLVSTDPSLAWRWLERSEYTCDVGSCNAMYVIARDGCPTSLYVEVAILDANKTNVGYSNDVANNLAPRQQAKLVFDYFEKDAASVRATQFSCR